MTDELRNSLMLILATLGFIGGPVGVYVAMKSQITRLETKMETLINIIEKLEKSKESHTEDFTEVREQIAKLWTDLATVKEQTRSNAAVIDWLRQRLSVSSMPAIGRRGTRGDGGE